MDVDASFGDLLEDVDFALFGMVFARRDDLVLLADASWSNSSRDGRLPPGLPAEGGLRQASLTLLVGRTLGGDAQRSFALLGGLRAWSIRARAEAPLIGLRASPSLDFADPVVAGRLDWRLGERWSAFFYGDVGGFGISSELTWQLVGTANYRLDNGLQVSGGYRLLRLDYARGGAIADVDLSGPVVGITYSF